MKAILIIEMPNKCDECNYYDGAMCFLTAEKKWEGVFCREVDDWETREKWCPLKPIPKKVKSASEYGSDEEYIKHLINWKKEIDEILGEEE